MKWGNMDHHPFRHICGSTWPRKERLRDGDGNAWKLVRYRGRRETWSLSQNGRYTNSRDKRFSSQPFSNPWIYQNEAWMEQTTALIEAGMEGNLMGQWIAKRGVPT